MGKNSGNAFQLISSFGVSDLLEHEEVRESEWVKYYLADARVHGNSVRMSGITGAGKRRFDWREDLCKARDLTRREIDAYGYVLGWIEDWRRKKDLPVGREAMRRWWKEVAQGKERQEWQLRQCVEAIGV